MNLIMSLPVLRRRADAISIVYSIVLTLVLLSPGTGHTAGHTESPAVNSISTGFAELSLQPHPDLTPQQVVDFQLTALKNGGADGIEATFRFASPANRTMTGPVARFARLFDSPQYQPMMNNRGTEIKLDSNDGNHAEVIAGVVDSSGTLHWYRFNLSRQSESPYINCWMTDAVIAIPHPGRSA